MYFISLFKFRKKPNKVILAQNLKWLDMWTREGVKIHGIYWTLGRYDAIGIFEAPNAEVMMKGSLRRGDVLSSETLVAIPAEEARKFVE